MIMPQTFLCAPSLNEVLHAFGEPRADLFVIVPDGEDIRETLQMYGHCSCDSAVRTAKELSVRPCDFCFVSSVQPCRLGRTEPSKIICAASSSQICPGLFPNATEIHCVPAGASAH